MSLNSSVMCLHAGTAGDVHKLGIDPEKTYGTHTLVHTPNTFTMDFAPSCDFCQILKIQSNVPLRSMKIQECVTDFSLTNLVQGTPGSEEDPFVYTFPWKVEYPGGMCSNTIVLEPVNTMEKDQEVKLSATIKYTFVTAKNRSNIIINGKQALTTHSYTSKGKPVSNRSNTVSFPLQNYSRTNGLFVHNLCADDVARITLTLNGADTINVETPHLEEVVRVYNKTSMYLPLNGKMDPRPDDFQGSYHLGCISSEWLTVEFKPGVEGVEELYIQTLDLVFLRMTLKEPNTHPHFVYPKKRKSEEVS
jgi:hypothetical protein